MRQYLINKYWYWSYPLRARWCSCGEMRFAGGSVELAGVKHQSRKVGPCFPCDEYGEPDCDF